MWRHKNTSKKKDCNEKWEKKPAVERPILKLWLPNFRWSFYSILFNVATLLFISIFMTSHMTLYSASISIKGCDTWRTFGIIFQNMTFSWISNVMKLKTLLTHMVVLKIYWAPPHKDLHIQELCFCVRNLLNNSSSFCPSITVRWLGTLNSYISIFDIPIVLQVHLSYNKYTYFMVTYSV